MGWPQGGAGPAQGTLPLAFVPSADKAHRPACTPGGPGRHWGPRWGQPTWQCVTGTCPRPDDSCRQGERDRVPGPCDCRPRSIRSVTTETPPRAAPRPPLCAGRPAAPWCASGSVPTVPLLSGSRRVGSRPPGTSLGLDRLCRARLPMRPRAEVPVARTPVFSGEHGLARSRPLSHPDGPPRNPPQPGEHVGSCASGPRGEAGPVSAAENRVLRGKRAAAWGLGDRGLQMPDSPPQGQTC